jgi:beta-aspartyl-peptidase (threonine type)
VLQAGGSAVDAVEAGIRLVEANPEDHSVGIGGYPDMLGQVALDAAIMDGRDLLAGAVAAVQRCPYPISLARQVMERLPHVLLVGKGAERFAAEIGFELTELLTEEVREAWQGRLPEIRRAEEEMALWRQAGVTTDPERRAGTVNFIAQDRDGHLCAGVSTSGWAWRYPGRVGDSPIIGAGLYADSRYGAAACTGMGEMAIRAGTALSVVHYLRAERSVADAGRQAMEELNDLGGRYLGGMNLIALDRDGQHAGFSSAEDRIYIYISDGMSEPAEQPRICVPLQTRWGDSST